MPNPRQDPNASLLETAMSLGLPVSASDTTDVKVAWAIKELAATRGNGDHVSGDVSFYGQFGSVIAEPSSYNTLSVPANGTTRAFYEVTSSVPGSSWWDLSNLINAGIREIGLSFTIEDMENPVQFRFMNGTSGPGFEVISIMDGRFLITLCYNEVSSSMFISNIGSTGNVVSVVEPIVL